MDRRIMLAALLLLSLGYAASAMGNNYPGTTGASGGTDSTTPQNLMKVIVSENCSGIYVTVLSGDYLADNPAVPNASIEVDALPRSNINVLATGTTDKNGVFAFNTSASNISVIATKQGFQATRAEFAPQHPSCSPSLSLSIAQNCTSGQAVVSVLADSKPLERALISVNGQQAGYTDAAGEMPLELPGPANITVTYQGAEADTIFSPDCPKNEPPPATAPPSPQQPANPPSSPGAPTTQPSTGGTSPQQPGAPLNVPLVVGVLVVMVVLLYALSRFLGKGGKSAIGPGPIPPAKEIGPGPMKSKSQIGPGPMKKEIGPGPM